MKSKHYFKIILALVLNSVIENSNAQAPDWLWAKAMGGIISHSQGKSIANDAATGDVYISGYFSGTFDFDPGPEKFNLTSIGNENIFISKFNVLGQLVWVKAIGGTAHDEGKSITVDAGSGNIYVMGYFSGTVDFDPDTDLFNLTSTGSQSVFICKLDNAGNFIWAKALGETVQTYGDHSITVDPAGGDVYFTGSFTNTVDFDPGESSFNLTSDDNGDMFISKLNSSGDFVWAIAMDGTESSKGNAVSVDPQSGFLYTIGDFKEKLDFDHILISKLDSSGNVIWAKKIRGGQYSSGIAIVFDPSGNGAVYTSGVFNAIVDFDPGAAVFNLNSTGNSDVFISKLNSSGDFVWAKQMGGPGNWDYISVNSMAFDPAGSGAVYTSGFFVGDVNYGAGQDSIILTGSLDKDIYFSKLDSSGNFVWAKQLGVDFCNSIAVGPGGSGTIYTLGGFTETVDFDPGAEVFNLTSIGSSDMFISKLNNSGEFGWAKTIRPPTGDAGLTCIAVDPTEHEDIFTIGTFTGTVDFNLDPDTFNLTSDGGGHDIYISKSDNSGHFLWAKSMEGNGYVNGLLTVVDQGSRDVYISGNFLGTIDFDPGPDTFNLTSLFHPSFFEEGDIFISKLDADGNFKWAKSIVEGGGNLRVTSITLDPSANGDVYSTGYFYGIVDFDPGPGIFNLTSEYYESMFISKLDSLGNFVWAKKIGGDVHGYSITLDPENGSVYTTGSFSGMVDFDPGPDSFNLTSVSYVSMFISKLDNSGAFKWAISGQGNNISEGKSIVIDPTGSGDIYIAGYFDGTFFDLTSAGYEDFFISKLDDSGHFKWTKGAGGPGTDWVSSLVVDTLGNNGVYTAGHFNGIVDFDPGPDIFNLSSSTGEDEMFISKLDGTGNFEWVIAVNGNHGIGPYPIALDHSGHLYVSGSFQTPSISFGYNTLFNEDDSGQSSDVFIAKLDTLFTTSSVEIKKHPIHIYPNPATNELTIEIDEGKFSDAGVSLFNILGEIVFSGPVEIYELRKTIDISALAAGIYFVELIIDGNRVIEKVVKE